jgi:hypothetical protein
MLRRLAFRRHFVSIVALCLSMSVFSFEVTAQERAPGVSIANLPITFEPNAGQVEPVTRFVARTVNTELRLRPSGFDLWFRGTDGRRAQASLLFVDALPQVKIAGEIPESSQTNYLIGNDQSHWRTHIPNFGRVRYSGLYPKIDLVFHGNGAQLEHDFVVSPGGDVRGIRMRMVSPGRLARNPDGSIKISTPDGDLLLTNPSIYQVYRGKREPRQGRFVLKAHNEIGFEIGKYDRSRPLIIDPLLILSTFLAPTEISTSGVATDTAGNTYVTGLSFSSFSPAASSNAFQKACNSCNGSTPDVFVMKLDPTGSQVLYSTFLGGSNYDQPSAIAVDAGGNAVVAGYTQSTDFPVKNAIPFQPAGLGAYYGFVTSLAPDGSSLNYSSLLGGVAQTQQGLATFATALGLDSSGNAYVSGQTDSPAFPVTSGAFHNATPAYPNNVVFVSKFLTDGSLAYSALIGDVSIQQGGGCCFSGAKRVQVDSSGSAYILGRSGALWPTTAGAYQTQLIAPSNEAIFLTKLSSDASHLIYSTFVGPDSLPSGMAIDGNGDVFFTGQVNYSFPLKNAYQSTFPGICCASYLAELDPTGSNLLYGTYFSGNGSYAAGTSAQTLTSTVQLDAKGNIWLAGTTTDAGFPLVQPVQSTLSTSAFTGFVSEFDPTGTTLLFSTYLGSISQGSQSLDLAIDPNGKEHIAGVTGPDLYITPGAFLNAVTPPAPNTMPVWGFAAVIDPTGSSPALCLGSSTGGVPYGPVMVGTSFSRTVTLTNCGTSSLTISSIATSLSVYTVPLPANKCLTPVAPNATCTFSVVFAPTTAGFFPANVTINANTPIPQTVLALFGDGTVPVIQLNSSSITFDPLFIGQTGSKALAIIFNAGQAPLLIDAAHTTISPNPTFTMQNGCTQHVPPRQSCALFLTFTAPNSPGTTVGTLSIASNDPANPVVTVNLSGTALSAYTVPAITSVDHPTVPINSGPVTLTVFGQNFFPTSTIFVNGVAQQITYNSASFISAQLGSSLFTSMGELRVTVANPTPGGGTSNAVLLTIYGSVPITPAGLIYDAVTQLLYTSIPANAAANPNTIISIDPLTGNTGTPIPVGHDPKQLALSQDGSYLYVAVNGDHAVQRINMSTLAVDATFSLPTPPAGAPGAFPLAVSDLKVVPGTSQSFVVSLLVPGVSPPEAGIALYNSSGLVNWLPSRLFSNSSTDVVVDSFAFAGNPPLVYALPGVYDPYPTGIFFGTFMVDSSGIHTATLQPVNSANPIPSGLVASDGKLLFTSSGQVWNPATQTFIGSYSPSSIPGSFVSYTVVPDDSEGRTFFLNPFAQYDQQGAVSIDAYDQVSFQKIGSVPFFSASVPSTNVLGLTRWGSNGLAFAVGNFTPALNSNQVIIFQSGIAGSAASTQTTLSLSSPNASFGQAVTFTAAVGAGGNPVTSGSVAFFDNGTQIGIVNLDSSGQASLAISTLVPGLHTVSAIFSGSSGFQGSNSATATETIVGIPASSLAPASLSFSSQTVGTTSATQTILLSNPGSADLSISSITITGVNNGDFSITITTCPIAGGILAEGSNCTIEITFTPQAAGARNANLTVTDNAAGSPQSASLTGTASDLSLSAAPGGSTSATVAAGQTATFNLEISPVNGLQGTVTLTCTGAPANSTCSTTPSTLMLANAPAPFTVSVSTMSQSGTAPFADQRFRLPSVPWMPPAVGGLAFGSDLFVCFVTFYFYRSLRRPSTIFGSAVLLCVLLTSCGGGGTGPSLPAAPSPGGTPAGTYTLTTTARSGVVSHSTTLTLTVQ